MLLRRSELQFTWMFDTEKAPRFKLFRFQKYSSGIDSKHIEAQEKKCKYTLHFIRLMGLFIGFSQIFFVFFYPESKLVSSFCIDIIQWSRGGGSKSSRGTGTIVTLFRCWECLHLMTSILCIRDSSILGRADYCANLILAY